MKRPNIGKRLLPLLDVMFLLLALFIILPHGITSKEFQTIRSLQDKNDSLEKTISFYEWKLGTPKTKAKISTHKVFHLHVNNNRVLWKEQMFSWTEIKNRLRDVLLEKKISFVVLQVSDSVGDPTQRGTIEQIGDFFKDLSLIHIVSHEGLFD